MRDFWADSLKNIPNDMLFSDGCMYVSNMDKLFIQESKCLTRKGSKKNWHYLCLGRNQQRKRLRKQFRSTSPGLNMTGLQILSKWTRSINYQSFSNGIKAQDEMNPVTEWASGFLTNKVCSFMSEPPPTLSSGSCDKDRLLVMKMNNLAFNLIRYYWHVG